MSSVNYSEQNTILFESYTAATDNQEKLDIENQIIQNNMKHIYQEAHHFTRSGLEFEDVKSLAMIGLLKAIRKFKPENGNQFITYAYTVVRNDILRYLKREKRLSHIQFISVDYQQEGLDVTVGDSLADERVDIEKQYENNQFINLVRHVAKEMLTTREYIIFENMVAPKQLKMTKTALGIQIGLSKTRMGQLESTIVQKMKYHYQQAENGQPLTVPERQKKGSTIFTPEQFVIMKRNGISSSAAINRVKACGWTIEKAINTPIGEQGRKRVTV